MGIGKLGILVIFISAVFLSTTATALAADTYVSLTFDDGRASQVNADYLMSLNGMHGTFYVNSGLMGTENFYMPLSQVQSIAAAGNEIGGHSKTHPNLTTIPTSVAEDEICSDQQQLQALGFAARSFAYPYGAQNTAVQGIVNSCDVRGYNVLPYKSARNVGHLQCPACYATESLPPVFPYNLKTISRVALLGYNCRP